LLEQRQLRFGHRARQWGMDQARQEGLDCSAFAPPPVPRAVAEAQLALF
jgi:hypothetical protein